MKPDLSFFEKNVWIGGDKIAAISEICDIMNSRLSEFRWLSKYNLQSSFDAIEIEKKNYKAQSEKIGTKSVYYNETKVVIVNNNKPKIRKPI